MCLASVVARRGGRALGSARQSVPRARARRWWSGFPVRLLSQSLNSQSPFGLRWHHAAAATAAAVLPAMEQLPEQPDERVRPAAAERIVRRRHSRVRGAQRKGAQDGSVCVQSLLPGSILRQSVSAPHRHPQGHQVARIEGRRRVHVQRRN